jgi:hypothetical protein
MKRQNTRNTGSEMKNTNDAVKGGLGAWYSRKARWASVALALCALAVPLAHAQTNGASGAGDAVPNSEIGHSTRAWLDLQRSNAQAAPTLPMLGAEAGYAWQRYLKSFETAIPATFGSSVDSGQNQINLVNSTAGASGGN